MTELSPAAQAVLNAYWESPWDPSLQHEDGLAIAAVLRAAAVYSYCPVDRQRLASIAEELEAQ